MNRVDSSRFKVKTDSDLVTAGVEILPFEQRGQRHLNAGAKGVREREADLGVVVDLGCDGGVGVDGVFRGESEAGGRRTFRPRQLDTRAQSRRHLLEERSGKVGSVVEKEVDLEVSAVMSEGEVGFRQLGGGRVEGQLSTDDP